MVHTSSNYLDPFRTWTHPTCLKLFQVIASELHMISRLNVFSPWQTGLARRAPRWLLQPWSERSACPPNEENIHWLDTSDYYGLTLNYVTMDHTLKSKEQNKDSEDLYKLKKIIYIPCGNLQPSFGQVNFDWFGNQLLSMNKSDSGVHYDIRDELLYIARLVSRLFPSCCSPCHDSTLRQLTGQAKSSMMLRIHVHRLSE